MPAENEARKRDAERSRRAILTAAERLFAERGYRGASLQEIGEAAGVSRGTPSYFFGSKAGVYRAVLERNFGAVAAVLRELREAGEVRGASADELLRTEIEAYFEFLVKHPTFVRLVQWEALTGGEVVGTHSPRVDLLRETMAMVEREMERGSIRRVDPLQLVLSIMGLCWFPLAEKDTVLRSLGMDPFEEEFVENRKRHVVDLVTSALRIGAGSAGEARP